MYLEMDLESKGFLSDYPQMIVKDSIICVMQDYDKLPGDIKAILALTRAEGKLDDMYSVYTAMQDKERDDDAREEISSMVGQHTGMILDAFDVDRDEFQ